MIIKAQSPVYGGYVIAREGGVVFIRGALPEEVVEVSITEKKKDYSVGTAVNIIEPSPFRIDPPCPVFGICGGCHLQFISYESQIQMKEEILLDSLRRIGGVETALSTALTDEDYNYRHRGQFKISQPGAIGFYREGTRDVVPIEECPLMISEINILLKKLKDINPSSRPFSKKGIKEIHVSCGDAAVALIKGKPSADQADALMEAGFSGVAFENGESMGRDYTKFDLNGLRYAVTPWSFFQAHWNLNRRVVELVANELRPMEGARVLDLYAGAGNFSLPVSAHASHVVAVEENPHAIEDGQRNANSNNIKNCRFVKASAEKYKINEKFDILMLDPPRPGLSNEVMKKIVGLLPQKVVYVSCNPATFARDLKMLKEKYNIDSIRMIDFFPNTYHIEALAFLSLK